MKVALIRSPTVVSPDNPQAFAIPPIGLAYIKAATRPWASEVTVVDSVGEYPKIRVTNVGRNRIGLMGETASEIATRLAPDTEVALISMMFTADWPYSREVLKAVRERCPKALIVCGGEHISAVPDFSMSDAPQIDVCVIGEGEAVVAELLAAYSKTRELPTDVAGTHVRLRNGGIRVNERQARIADLSAISQPDWDGFPLENYFKGQHSYGTHRGRSMPILATRGCPYQCTFCSNPRMWTTTWKARDPRDVLSEIQLYMRKYDATNFDFYDLTAIVKREWIIDFCRAILAEKLTFTWQLPSGTRSEAIDREVAELLYEAGCRNFAYAPETGSPRVLDLIKKRAHLPKMIESMKHSVRAGISIKVNFVCGFPGERIWDAFVSLWFVARIAWLGVHDASAYQFVPYPGSELFDLLRTQGRISLNDEYLESLTFYSSMSGARSFNDHMSNRVVLIYKYLVPALFYSICYLRRPWRIVQMVQNVIAGRETTRMDKILRGYVARLSNG